MPQPALCAPCHKGDLMQLVQNGAPVEVVLRRSSRARRISLRVSALDGRVTLTLPPDASEAEALAFARTKEDWIRSHLSARGSDVPVALDSTVMLRGETVRVVPGTGRRIVVQGEEMRVPGPAAQVARRVQGHLKALARAELAAASDRYAAALGRPYRQMTLRDTRSRWGSCTAAGGLMYSWRLIMMPPAVLDYVAAHEVAHLAYMNHSAAFWQVVEDLYGAYDAPRAWLRREGGTVHRYRFST